MCQALLLVTTPTDARRSKDLTCTPYGAVPCTAVAIDPLNATSACTPPQPRISTHALAVVLLGAEGRAAIGMSSVYEHHIAVGPL